MDTKTLCVNRIGKIRTDDLTVATFQYVQVLNCSQMQTFVAQISLLDRGRDSWFAYDPSLNREH